MFMSLAVTVAAATEMARDRAMVPHMAHVATDLRGKESKGTRGGRQVLMPMPASIRNATPMHGI